MRQIRQQSLRNVTVTASRHVWFCVLKLTFTSDEVRQSGTKAATYADHVGNAQSHSALVVTFIKSTTTREDAQTVVVIRT